MLQFNVADLWLSQRMGLRLVSYTPADERTLDAVQHFDELTPHPLP